jgi:hypothetical protein
MAFGYLVTTSWYTESAAAEFPAPLYASPMWSSADDAPS